MSYTKDITVWCDYCPEWAMPDDTAMSTISQARKNLHQYGWRIIQGEDVCPKCMMDAA